MRAAALQSSDVVLEIGTGEGVLTEKLAPHVSRVFTYEIDHNLVLASREILSKYRNVFLSEGDIFDSKRGPVQFDVCASSLPYSRSRDFVEWLSKRSGSFRHALAVLQLDFVKKLLAGPSDFQYRSLSVIAQIAFDIEVLGQIERASFKPPPKVESVIVRFVPNRKFEQPFLGPKRIQTLRKLFSFKGRLLRKALRYFDFEHVSDLRQDEFSLMRIEQLSPDQFAMLLENIRENWSDP